MTAIATEPRLSPGTAPARRHARAGGGAPSVWPRITAGIHLQGASVKVVIARQDTPDSPPSVVESLSLPAADPAALASLLAKHKVADAVRLVPSVSTVARCTPLPAGLSADRAQAAAALALLAESEMPSMIPAHRRAAGIIHPGPNAAQEAVLVVGWPDRGDTPSGALPVRELTFTPELVALAALARSLGGAEFALYADRQAGSIALIATGAPYPTTNGVHPNGAVNGTPAGAAAPKTAARVLRGEMSSDAAWHASIRRAVAETAASLAIPPAPIDFTDAAPASLILLGSPMRRPRGVPSDPAWLAGYGLAYGALSALADTDPAARPLALLRASAQREHAGPVVRLVEYLARPKRAAIAFTICLAVFLFWPLGVAKSREMILAGRAGGTEKLQQRLKEAERRVAFYQQLREKRWPMTKLVADIAGAAPVGVHVDTLSLSREQGLTIRGRAEKPEQVTDFRANLTASGVFGSVNTPSVETESGAITFQLEAQVVAPQYAGPRAGDFVKEPLAVRMYGERARGGSPDSASSSTTAAAPTGTSAPAASDSPRSGRPSRTGLRDTGNRDDAATSSGTRRPAAGASAIPEPLTDADIATMDANTAMKEWSGRKKAASISELDPAIKQRLLEEAEKCRARMVEARKG